MKVYVLKDPTGQIKGVYSKKETADLIQSRTKGLNVFETNLDEREGNFTNLESLYHVLIDKNGNCTRAELQYDLPDFTGDYDCSYYFDGGLTYKGFALSIQQAIEKAIEIFKTGL